MIKCILGCIKHSMASQLRELIILLYFALMQPHLECCVQFWATQFTKYVQVLERVQGRATKPVEGLEGISCEKQLSAFGSDVSESLSDGQWCYRGMD